MVLIGVSGKKRAGKDTFYSFLSSASPKPVVRTALADALKQEIYEFVLKPNGLGRELLDSDEHKEKFRTILQWWGTEFRRRMFRDDYWLVKLGETVDRYADQDVVLVVTDIRFPNEFDYIKSRGGLMVRVERPGIARGDGLNEVHPSETALDEETRWDSVIENNGDLSQFESLVKIFAGTVSSGVSVPRLAAVG